MPTRLTLLFVFVVFAWPPYTAFAEKLGGAANGPAISAAAAPAPRSFSVHDANGDNLLSRSEYRNLVEHIEARRRTAKRPMRRVWPPMPFEAIDANGDEFISEDELVSALNERLRQRRREKHWYR
jgi:hypothetical protein